MRNKYKILLAIVFIDLAFHNVRFLISWFDKESPIEATVESIIWHLILIPCFLYLAFIMCKKRNENVNDDSNKLNFL